MPGVGRNTQVTVTLSTISRNIHGSKDSIEIKIKDSNILLKQITPARELNSVRKLGAPGVSQATEAALRSVWQPTSLPTAPAGAKNVSAGTNIPRPPTPSVPLRKLLGRQGLTGTRLLLALASTKASTLCGSTSTSTTAAATSTTANAASTTPTAATEAPTRATTLTSTAIPSASSTASTAAPTVPSTTLAPLALAVAASPTRSRRSPDLLSANEVDSSSRSNRASAPWPPIFVFGPSAPSAIAATAATAAPAYFATMASLRVLAFYHEGRPVQFDMWLDALQLYLLSDIKDGVSLFDHVFGAATAPPTTADSATRSQWLSCDAAARLAIRSHLPLAECAHFRKHRTAQTLYNTVVGRYSSPATAALGRLLLPYLFPELSAFDTVEDLVSHLRASDARYHAAVSAEFLDKNQPPMFITLYFLVTHLPDSLRSVRDHFLSLDPTSLTLDLLEQHLLAAETSAVAVGAARGTPRPPFFEGCSPSPLAPSYASAAAADVSVAEDVGAAAARERAARVVEVAAAVVEVAAGVVVGAAVEVVAAVGLVEGVGALVAAAVAAVGLVSALREWFLCGASGGICPYVIRMVDRAGQTCGRLHTHHRCFSRLDDAWRAEFGDDVELSRRADLLRSRIAIFDLDFDAILSAMYALSVSAEGDCYQNVLPNPGIAAADLGASEFGTLPGTAPARALHTFMLDSGASACFFRDSTTLTPLSTPVPVRLADPAGGPVVARSSTVLPCPTVPSGSLSGLNLPSFSANLVSTAALQDAMVTTTTPGGQRVTICTCTRTGRHLATFTRRPGSSLYTQATKPPQVAASAQVSASGQVAACCSCRLLSHQTLLWHHRLGHPSLPRLRGMHSRLLGQDVDVLIPWIRTVRLQLRECFGQDLPVLRLHSDRGGEFSYNLLRDICRGEGILQSFTLPDSPQQNGIAERRIGLVMEVARTSMIHAAAPHFLWSFAGLAPSGVSQVDPLPGAVPVEVAGDSGAARGAASGGVGPGGEELGGAKSEGARSGGAEPGGAEPEGTEHAGCGVWGC
ncbi:unnamed protein product [Closterium sp. NIES-54]